MPKVTLPNTATYKVNLEVTKWYILSDPNPRLILAVDQLPSFGKTKGGYWIYDPAKRVLESISDEPQLAWEVDVEIKGL